MGIFSTIEHGLESAYKGVVHESHKFEDWSRGFDERSHGWSNLIPFYGFAKAVANIETSIDDQSKGKISTGKMFLNFAEDEALGAFSLFTGVTGASALAGGIKMGAEAGVQGIANLATRATASQVARRAAGEAVEAGAQHVGDELRTAASQAEKNLRYRKTQGLNELGEVTEKPIQEPNIFDRMKSKFRKVDTPAEKIEKLVKRLPKPSPEELKQEKPKIEQSTEQVYNELSDNFKKIFDRNIKTKSNRNKLGIDGRMGEWEDDVPTGSKFTDKTPYHDVELRGATDALDQGLIAREDIFKEIEKTEEKQKKLMVEDDNIDWEDFDMTDDYEKPPTTDKINPNWRDSTTDRRTPLQKINMRSNIEDIKAASEGEPYNPQSDLDRAYNTLTDDLPEDPTQKLSYRIRQQGGFKLGGNIISIV